MNRNLSALVKACKNLNYEYSDDYHYSKNLVSVSINNTEYLFVNWTTPINYQSSVHLCKDKDFFYSYFKDVVKMPETIGFLNPYCKKFFRHYAERKTLCDIIEFAHNKFNYPFIVKRNRGSWGSNVFKVYDKQDLESSLIEVFNMNSSAYDYICLTQEMIDIKEEYRSIFLNGQLQFAYEKNIEDAEFSGNLSPLHWEGAKASFITDKTKLNDIQKFCEPVFKKQLIPFCGLDIAIDKDGKFYLIEANSSPGFDKIIQHEGEKKIIELYENILKSLDEKK